MRHTTLLMLSSLLLTHVYGALVTGYRKMEECDINGIVRVSINNNYYLVKVGIDTEKHGVHFFTFSQHPLVCVYVRKVM